MRSHGKVKQRPFVGEVSLNTDFGDEISNAADDFLVPLEDDYMVAWPTARFTCRNNTVVKAYITD
ncbi:hypothetical protein GCM10008985_09270 [Halococcus dombrowskii]|uniref:Transposase n=1 Tax=Halococcus dombrowskii TaxID=179637 RepID=A0AAV3SDS9_HALDO